MSSKSLCVILILFLAPFLKLVGRCASLNSGPKAEDSFAKNFASILPRNANSCAECHSVPTLGGSSKVTVQRIACGKEASGVRYSGIVHFHDGQTIHSEATSSRSVINLLGDGYVEAIADRDILRIASKQGRQSGGLIRGLYVFVALPDSKEKGLGRFGWKTQHATLLSASADAFANELGVPNRYFSSMNNGQTLQSEEEPALKEKSDKEISSFVQFVRDTDPISPDSEQLNSESAIEGSNIFNAVGCGVCHVRTFKTLPAGSRMASGETVPERLSNTIIHPFSDFLLHDIGTGDGLVQSIGSHDDNRLTANRFRTAPLWGVRFRSWLMHDGKSVTYHQAIMHHSGEAAGVIRKYTALTPIDKEKLRQFLDSL